MPQTTQPLFGATPAQLTGNNAATPTYGTSGRYKFFVDRYVFTLVTKAINTTLISSKDKDLAMKYRNDKIKKMSICTAGQLKNW